MEKAILGALFNDFVPKLTVETHILREFRSYLMKDVYLSGVIALRVPLFASDESVKSVINYSISVDSVCSVDYLFSTEDTDKHGFQFCVFCVFCGLSFSHG